MQGGRRIRLTGHGISDRLRIQLLYLGLTMTAVAKMLGVHKSDVSHALSPRARKKRYVKLRQRIRELLRRLKHRRPLWGYEAVERLGYKMDRDYHVALMHLCHEAIRRGAVIPPVSLYWLARSCLMEPSTFLKALRGDPKISAETRARAERLFEMYLRELWEDWVL